MLLAANKVVPNHLAGLELEAPMWFAPFRFELGPVSFGESERGAIVDRRLSPRELALPLQLQLILSLIGRIEPSVLFQLFDRGVIEREAVRLFHLLVPVESEPCQVLADAVSKFLRGTFAVGVVEPEQKVPLPLLREHPIEERGAAVAGMHTPRRTWREADGDRHAKA